MHRDMKNLLLPNLLGLLLIPMVACTAPQTSTPSDSSQKPFVAGAIPDQDPEKLQRLYSKLADYLEAELEVPVTYKPVNNYAAAVTAFRVGDLDMVWFGGLTGVQARLQVPKAQAIAQREIDAKFTSVFIANQSSGIKAFTDIKGLQALKGRTLTFGSESSTSGRLMPQYFMQQADLSLEDLKGNVGFSNSHDTTIKLVEAGTYETGALNAQVWQERVAAGEVDLEKVQVIWETPTYFDYHWVINPQVSDRYGPDFIPKVQTALLKLDPAVPEQAEILDLFGSRSFIKTDNSNYAQIEAIGRQIGKIK